MDGLNLFAAVRECMALRGGKIEKVQQPDREELLLTIRSGGESHRLLLCAAAERCGIQITQVKRENPMEAPMFCMLLRKHLVGGRLQKIEQPQADRVVILSIEARDELGDPVTYKLIAEIMGKHSNIILVNASGTVVDAIKRIGLGVSNVRVVLPGLPYASPPQQAKKDPTQADTAEFTAILTGAVRPDKALSAAFFGLSPSMAAALLASAGEDAGRFLEDFYARLAAGASRPHVLLDEFGVPIAVYPFRPAEENVQPMPSMAAAFDAYYSAREIYARTKQHGAKLRRVLTNNIARCEKKLALYDAAIDAEESTEKFRIYGDLLVANLYHLKPGMEEASLQNFYAEGEAYLQIPLDKTLSPNSNAQRYYKKYQKAKAARDMALTQRTQALEELRYLEGQLDNLDKCAADAELMEIGEELRQEGYIRTERGKKQQKAPVSKPLHFLSSDGTDIFVGKNNHQNDELTLRMAAPTDIWLHTKDIPGSHVIIKAAEPSKETLYEAAMLAAWYSRGRGGANVAVDYMPRKYVKKPSGSKPGMVIYTTNHTAYVTPDERLVKSLQHID